MYWLVVMLPEYDVVVVGGGPAGSMAAYEVAKLGGKVCLLEKDRDIGYPVRCGEAAGSSGIEEFFDIKRTWVAEKIQGVTLVSPNGKEVEVNFSSKTGYILNRRIFDYDLSRYASNIGAEIYTKAYVKNLIIENNFVTGVKFDYLGEEKIVKSKIVIGADGISSRIGRWGGIKTNVKMKDMESAIQYSVSNIDVKRNNMVMYVGEKYAPGGYLWIFPKGNRFANIGLGISGKHSRFKSAKNYLDEFMEKKFPNASLHTTMCGGVPCARPMRNPINNGLMLVGDAAHQINPLTGGGITSGMKGGSIAGKVAADAIKTGDYSIDFLKTYSSIMWSSFGKNYERFYKIKDSIQGLTDNDINSIAQKVETIPLSRRTLTSVFKATVFKKPSLIIDVMKAFSGV